MKKYVKTVIILTICLILSIACAFAALEFGKRRHSNPGVVTEPPMTDWRGREIPNHTDVDKSLLSPERFVRDKNGRMTYNDTSVKTYTGIDVSVFQGDIDWDAVKNDGIDFVMLRIGYRGYGTKGIMGEDANFRKNYEGAKKVGLKLGVYFFSQAVTEKEAEEEAVFVVNALNGCNIDYPVAYDWEFVESGEARTNGMTSEAITACAKAFCSVIAEAGYKPIIYFNCETGYFSYELPLVKDIDFWLAEYYDTPSFYYNYKVWQYSKKGSVDGIKGDVDLNISITDFSSPSAEQTETESIFPSASQTDKTE